MKEWSSYRNDFASLVIFHRLKQDEILQKWMTMAEVCEKRKHSTECVQAVSDFAAALFEKTDHLPQYIRSLIEKDENVIVKRTIAKEPVAHLQPGLVHELDVLLKIATTDARVFIEATGYEGFLPVWKTEPIDFHALFSQHLENLSTRGYGIFADAHMFTCQAGQLTRVQYSDPVTLSDLKGYEKQKRMIVDNTIALLRRKPAADCLLYGDAGTGKSSMIKALANTYRQEGLRLIEVPKRQFAALPCLVESLHDNPLTFIIFIDDLSFAKENDDFYALKAVLEGSVYRRASNTAVYATSNRRHLIKERFSDREGDDVHRNETLQELVSLSSRFGLSVCFDKPNKEEYQKIIRALLEQAGCSLDEPQIMEKAEQFAVSGRSPRVARQFVEMIMRTV